MQASKWTRLVLGAGLAGVLAAVVALPYGLLAGLGAELVAVAVADLPAALLHPKTPQASQLFAADGKTLVTRFADQNRTDVPLSAIAPVMRQAIVAAEDTRFYHHGAIDPRSILRALVANGDSGRVAQGASTLSMQYVRNVLKTAPTATAAQQQAATAGTLGRKLREIRYAAALQKVMTRDQILDGYLNVVYFGAGAYGVAAAARTYFDTTPGRLTLAQSALLAGIVQSPDVDDPLRGDRTAALARRAYVLNAMAKAGTITPADAASTAAQPLRLRPGAQPNGCTEAGTSDGGFFCDYFVAWWQRQPAFGATPAQRLTALREGGYRITLSMDPAVQATATAAATSVYGFDSARALPIAAVQPGTGRILALAVNRRYSLAADPKGHKGYPNTVDQLVAGGGAITGYQAGSTFKLFTMLAALQDGLALDTGFDAPARLRTSWRDGGPSSCGGYYCPVNDNPSWMDGHRTMWTGFGRSVNTYFVWLEQRVGAAKAIAMAQKLGIVFRGRSDAALAARSPGSWGSFTLGVADTTPLDLANAYATVAAQGTYCRPLPVNGIVDAAGKAVAAASPTCHQAIPADLARAAADAARCPVGQQSAYGRCDGGTAPQVDAALGGRPVAGKTGSSENNATETFVGFTPQVAVAGIAADPANPSDAVGAGVQRRVIDAVATVLGRAVKGLPAQAFAPPDPALAFGVDGPMSNRS